MNNKFASLLLLVSTLILVACESNETIEVPKEAQPETQPELQVMTDENSLEEIFHSVPEEYCPSAAKVPIQVLDVDNYFIASGEDVQCEFTVFLQSDGNFYHRIYGISFIENDEHSTQFLRHYSNGVWRPYSFFNVEQNIQDTSYIQLPKFDTTIAFIDLTTGEVQAELKWNGYEFITQDEIKTNCPHNFSPENREEYELISPVEGTYFVESMNMKFSIPAELDHHPFWSEQFKTLSFGPTQDAACLSVGDGINPSLSVNEYEPYGDFEDVEIHGRTYKQYEEAYLGGSSIITLIFDWQGKSYAAAYLKSPVNNDQESLIMSVLGSLAHEEFEK